MRYLLFHYTWSHQKLGQTGGGNLFAEFKQFPSNNLLKEKAGEVLPGGALVVIAKRINITPRFAAGNHWL